MRAHDLEAAGPERELGGETRAYPIPILNWHEIVNDEIDGQRFAITYCPLCGTAVAFDADIDGPQSVVYDEAENRLHVQKALMALVMGGQAH